MRHTLYTGVITLILSVSFWFICAPVSTNSTTNEEPTLLLLSLEETGRRTAEFSGAPIDAIIELDRDTVFNQVRWHTGQGEIVFTDSLLNKKGRRFTVALVWKKYPLVKDSASGFLYDTIYASMGGGLKRSNKVIVKVTNLPVVVDSASFNGSFFVGADTLWRYSFPDTAKIRPRYPLRFFARDLDNSPVLIQVLPSKGKIVRSATIVTDMEYLPPANDFVESISFIADDRKGGQAFRRMVITRITPNILPVVDSLRIETITLKGTGTYKIAFTTLDTLHMQLFAHDSLGMVKKAFWKSSKYTMLTDTANYFASRWICSTKECTDRTFDTSYVIDTISVKVVDDRNDTTAKLIALYKGTINLPPQIKTLLIDQKSIAITDTFVTTTVTGGLSASVKVQAVDPENDSLKTTWSTTVASRLSSKTDSTVRYSAPSVRGADTVHFTVSDGKSTLTLHIRFVITDISPALDSLQINDSLLKSPPATVLFPVNERDTVILAAFATDWDKEDTLRYSWSAGHADRFTLKQLNRAKYVLPAGNPKDTIVLTLQDGTVQLVRKIILLQKNRPPIVDSIVRNSRKIPLLSALEYTDKVPAVDTIAYDVLAHDPDGDSLVMRWSMVDSLRLLNKTGKTIRYISENIQAKDTVAITVSDQLNPVVMRKLIVQTDTTLKK